MTNSETRLPARARARAGTMTLALALFAFAGTTGTASAQSADARERFREIAVAGQEAFNAGDFEEAQRLWREARTVLPNPRIYRLLGRVATELGDHAEAVRMYRLALSVPDAGSPLGEARRRELAEALLPEAEQRVGELLIEREPEDAVITIDGDPVRADQPVLLAPGSRVLVARRPGFARLERTIEVRAGLREPIRVVLEAEPGAGEASADPRVDERPIDARAVDAPPPPLEPTGPDYAGPIAALAIAAAGAITFGIAGALTLAEDSRLADQECGTTAGMPSCSEDDLGTLRLRSLVADIGWITAALALAVGVPWLIVTLADEGGDTPSASLTPWATAEAAGLSLDGRF